MSQEVSRKMFVDSIASGRVKINRWRYWAITHGYPVKMRFD